MYRSNVTDATGDDAISLEPVGSPHPKGVITFYNGFNSRTKIDYPLSYFNTSSILEMIDAGTRIHPITRHVFDENELKRIQLYRECLATFPDVTHDTVEDPFDIIRDWLESPFADNEATKKAKYFVTYDDIIDFFGFRELNTREKAEAYFEANPDCRWIIRKSSITDTEYNKFFVIMTKKPTEYENFLFVHRQGYGIMNVAGCRNGNVATVDFDQRKFFTNMVDFLKVCHTNGSVFL